MQTEKENKQTTIKTTSEAEFIANNLIEEMTGTPVKKTVIDMSSFEVRPAMVNGKPIVQITGIANWDKLSEDVIKNLNLFMYNGVYVYRDNVSKEIITLDEDPKKIVRQSTVKLIPNLSPMVNKAIADAVVDRVERIDVKLKDNIVYFQNGELDTDTGVFTYITNPQFNHRMIPWEYKSLTSLAHDAAYATAIKTLNKTFGDISDGNPKIIKQIFEMMGASLLPTKVFGKAFFLLGSGRNGKSTLLNMIARIHGESKIARIPLEQMTGDRKSFTMIGLVNKSVNIIDDISHISMKENGVFKSMIAGEGLNAEVKGGKIFNFYNEATVISGANNMPNFADKGESTATLDRTVIIPLNHQFKRDPKGAAVAERLKQDDVIQVLIAFACEALMGAKKAGILTESDETKAAMKEFEEETDSVLYWLNTIDPFEKQKRFSVVSLYTMYTGFCKSVNRLPFNERTFGKTLKKHIPNIDRVRTTAEDGTRYYAYEVKDVTSKIEL